MSSRGGSERRAPAAGGRRRTPAGDAWSVVVVQILRLSALLYSAGDKMSKPAGQTSARWQVLAVLENGSSTVADTARFLGLARQSVQRVADLLERDGLAAYQDNPHHRRAKLMVLRPRGRAALRVIQAAQRVWADRLGAQIGTGELVR